MSCTETCREEYGCGVRMLAPNPACPKCQGYGELCRGACDLRIDEEREDILLVAQYAKTYADGPVWEAACRVLSRSAKAEVTR